MSTTPQRVLVTGGAGLIGSHIVDLLMDGREQGKYGEIVIVDNFVRGRHENLAAAKARGELTIIEGDISDRKLMGEVMQGIDLVFHLAAIRITQCAEDPRLAVDVLGNGTFNVLEAAVQANVKKVIAVILSLSLRSGRGVPHHRAPPPLQQPHALRRTQGRSTRACCAALTRCTA